VHNTVSTIFQLCHFGLTVAFRSAVCKLGAVALGWDKAFGAVDTMGDIDKDGRRWVEIDAHGVIVPVWTPLNMF